MLIYQLEFSHLLSCLNYTCPIIFRKITYEFGHWPSNTSSSTLSHWYSSKNLKRSVPRTMHCGTNCNTKIIEIPSHTRACKKIGGINKLWFLQTMEYCAALTRNEEYLCIPVGNWAAGCRVKWKQKKMLLYSTI